MSDFMAAWYRQRERVELARRVDPLGLLTTAEVGAVVDYVERDKVVRCFWRTDRTCPHPSLCRYGYDCVARPTW